MAFALADRCKEQLDAQISEVIAAGISEFSMTGRTEDFLTPILPFLRRGKRTRAAAAAAGWLAAGGEPEPTDALVSLGLALELYQAHALIHDDIIDHAATRRGMPALHVAYSRMHAQSGWTGDAHVYGQAAAILAGDYLLAAACDAAGQACRGNDAAWARWSTLTREVAVGQQLDVRAEHESAGPNAVEAAMAVILHKSARYSAVHPVALGALLAGAGPDLVARLDAITTPWGLAFQMRDDDLGVFGNSDVTGKPSGDDLREGKRTVLVALTLKRANSSDAAWLDSHLGRPRLTDDDIERARTIITHCGARAEHEKRIAEYTHEGLDALDQLALLRLGREACEWLADTLVDRNA